MIDLSKLTDTERQEFNDWEGYLTFIPTEVLRYVLHSPCKTTTLITANQFGKNDTINYDYMLRVIGNHPQVKKRIKPEDQYRIIRFASETLPAEKDDGGEIKNTQYPVLKRRLPKPLLYKDITARRPSLEAKPVLGGKPAVFEFVGYSQAVQSGAGVQRRSCYIDEDCPMEFYEEQVPRLLAADGDMMMSFTPVPGSIGWQFDHVFERARLVYRSKCVRDRLKKRLGQEFPAVEKRDGDDIFVIMAATDDNPIYERVAAEKSKQEGKTITAKEYLDEYFSAMYDDEDVIDARRYGLFRQLSGKLFKDFVPRVHKIVKEKYFPAGIPHDWKHFRGIDYHPSVAWACIFMSISPQNEAFVWNELNPSPEKQITLNIAMQLALMSGDYRYALNLIDPLADVNQNNTGSSVLKDLNRIFWQYKKEGIGTGAYWQAWDTKSQKGRDEVRKRLKNSLLCGTPFNNRTPDGKGWLPTLWITDNCQQTVLSMKNWRREEWANREMLVSHEEKETPQQRWSHFCMAIECLLKDPRVSMAREYDLRTYRPPKEYFARQI